MMSDEATCSYLSFGSLNPQNGHALDVEQLHEEQFFQYNNLNKKIVI
jgi:hypothetical protein